MYYSEPVAELSEKFLATFPPRSDGERWQVQWAVSGTEAVEMAIQMARVNNDHILICTIILHVRVWLRARLRHPHNLFLSCLARRTHHS